MISLSRWRPLTVVALAAFAAGLALVLLMHLLANSDVGGPGWSLRGNGALIVPFGLGPAAMCAGWVALVLRFRRRASWLTLAAGALVVALVLLVAGLAALSLPNSPLP